MKKLLTTIITITLFLLVPLSTYASTNTYNRNELENYGVKKNWTIDESNLNNVLKTPAVDASEKIYDFSELLTEEEEIELKSKIDNFIEKTNMDIVILTVNFPYSNDKENEDYAADFYDYNDFGMNVTNNSGILLLRNSNPEDPYYDMYPFGDAQLYFTQYRYDQILDGIYDSIHGGRYLEGFSDFIDRTDNYISAGIPDEMKYYYVDEKGYLRYNPPPRKYEIPWSPALIFALVVTVITMIILIKKNKMVYKATLAEEYLNKQSVNITNRKDVFLHTHTTSYRMSSDSGSSSGGSGGSFSSHSGSSGGGHSSGGGRHG
ncbi:MAG: TPM domain-containing protein [Bacilli bacterium]|nr:TPM domain-containing protein [Bacilli bacterium]